MKALPVVTALVMLSCTPAPHAEPEAPDWPVGSTPTLTIGTTEADPGHELSTVSGARMHGGQIVVANSGSSELRRFDSTGKYLGSAGRKGQGPGEFEGIFYLFPAPGDSLYTLDTALLCWSIYDQAGRFGRVIPGGESALSRPSWLYHRTLVQSNGPVPAPAWAMALLDRLPEPVPGSPIRTARFDDLGYLWVTDSATANIWSVFADTGRSAGRVTLPAGFALLQAGAGFVLGVERDAMDRELVRIYSLARPASLTDPATAPAELPLRNPGVESRLLADVMGLMTAQEMFYSNHASYTSKADSLAAKLASGAELVLLSGDKRHWAGILYEKATRTTCGISVGFPAPSGWSDGTPFCGR